MPPGGQDSLAVDIHARIMPELHSHSTRTSSSTPMLLTQLGPEGLEVWRTELGAPPERMSPCPPQEELNCQQTTTLST